MNILIIGGGVCGTSAAEEIRKCDAGARITIISNEPHPLYSRVLLPHYIHGMIPRERVFLKSQDWYREHNITLVFDEVTALDCTAQTATGASDKVFPYDKLLIAGGGIVNRLPLSTRKNAFHFQTIEDADAISTALKARRGKPTQAHIIGGGFISMEFIDLFQSVNFETNVHLRDNHFFSHLIDSDTSEHLAALLRNSGVIIHEHSTAHDFDGTTLTTESTSYPCQLLGIGIGLDARFPWAAKAGVATNHGVVVNAFLETNKPNVYAAGDGAECEHPLFGRHRRVGNWTNAQMQGRHVAGILFGKREPFTTITSYTATVCGIHMVAIGDADPHAADAVVSRTQDDGRTSFYIRRNRIVGAVTINRSFERAPLTKLITAQIDISPCLPFLQDPEHNLARMLDARDS